MITFNEKRSQEIWSTVDGETVCVSDKCMGSRLASEITNNPSLRATFDGSYRLTPNERQDLRFFIIEELGQQKVTCTCGRVAL